MTDNASLVNLALQSFGDRTTITAAQLAAGSNNQAKQANLTFENTRDSLLRMAPWDCAMKTDNLTWITSVPGTPENPTIPSSSLWNRGIPRPPWAYEYQYPLDCLRACWIIPATQTGYTSGVPITTAVTGGASTLWNGGPIRFKIATDQFRPVIGATIVTAGTDYEVQDLITLTAPTPTGAPAQIRVDTVGGAGEILTFHIINQVLGQPDSEPIGGSYFNLQPSPTEQGSTSGFGTGATWALSQGLLSDQRVILTNQELATLVYVRQATEPNVWDPLFQDAFVNALGGDICLALTGDKALAQICYGRANNSILEARKADGNEGLTINDVTPDWIRARGIAWTDNLISGPYSGFDWGGLYGVGS